MKTFYCCSIMPITALLLELIDQHTEIGITLIPIGHSFRHIVNCGQLAHRFAPCSSSRDISRMRMLSCTDHAPMLRLSKSPLDVEHCVLQLRMNPNIVIGSVITPGLTGNRRQFIKPTEITSSSFAD